MNPVNDSFPRYYIKKSGRITGPFSLLKVKSMFHSGAVSGYDMFSMDKVSWQSIYLLFPHLIPGKEKVDAVSGATSGSPFPVNGGNVSDAEKENGNDNAARAESKNFFVRFLCDTAETISLVWKYPVLSAEGGRKWKRWLFSACILHFVTATVMVLLFGKYYSKSFHYIFSLLRAWGGVSVLLLFCFLPGYFLIRCGNKEEVKSKENFLSCSVALFVDHGIVMCALMALLHAVVKVSVPGIIVLMIVNGIVLCASSRLLAFSLKEARSVAAESVYLVAVPFNAVFCLLIWYLVKII